MHTLNIFLQLIHQPTMPHLRDFCCWPSPPRAICRAAPRLGHFRDCVFLSRRMPPLPRCRQQLTFGPAQPAVPPVTGPSLLALLRACARHLPAPRPTTSHQQEATCCISCNNE